MKRVSFYFDGFNFYYGLKASKLKRYYWLDLTKFSESFLKKHQKLIDVNYFSAVQKDDGKRERQDLFFSANKLNKKFKLSLGKFLPKKIDYKGKTHNTYEEKQTDVKIAVKMIKDVVYDNCDISILVSADSDIIPAIEFIREYNPMHKIIVYFPPARFSYDLRQIANKSIKLDHHIEKFEKAILPSSLILPNNYTIKKPSKWK